LAKPKYIIVLLTFLLVMSTVSSIAGSLATVATPAPAASEAGSLPPSLANLFGPTSSSPRIEYGLSFWTMGSFAVLTNGCSTVACYSDAIQKYLLPHDVYWVPLYQYGDANTSRTCQNSMCLQPDVSNLLSAGDQFGMHFLFWLPVWGEPRAASPPCTSPGQETIPWQTQVLNYWSPGNPAAIAEVGPTGNTVCVLRMDYLNLWEQQIHRDVSEIVSTYGSHPSFAGFLQYFEFSVGDAAYDNTGFSNQTIANFTRTSFYQNVTQFQPFLLHDTFSSGNGFWSATGVGTSGAETSQTIDGSDGFYGGQTSATTAPVTIRWTPTGSSGDGLWQSQSTSNETFWFYPTSSNTGVSSITVTFNFQEGNDHAATESYSVTPSVTWNAWNRFSVDWWKSYLSTHHGETYDNLTSIQVTQSSGSTPVTSQLIIGNAYNFQADWLGRTVNTAIKADFIANFERSDGSAVDGNVVVGNNLPTGSSLPLKLLGGFDAYKSYVFQEVLNNVASFCQALHPECIVTADATGGGSPGVLPNTGFTEFNSYSMQGGQTQNSWPSTYGANVEGTTCSSSFNCGIGRGNAQNNYAFSYANPFIGGGAVGWGCGTSNGGQSYTCNNGNYNTVQALPYQLAGSFPNQITPIVWLQTNPQSLVSNFTNDANNDVPPDVGAITGQDFAYNQRPFAMTANNVGYEAEPGYSNKPLANILYVNQDPWDGNSHAAANFLTPQFLESVGFNVTVASVTEVKHLDLLKFNAIVWTSLDQPNEANDTTYNDIANAVNNGVGFILADNAGSGYNGGTGITSTTLNNLFGLTYPQVGCCDLPSDPVALSDLTYSTSSSVAREILAPYGSLLESDLMPNISPEAYLYQTTPTFGADRGIVIATGEDRADEAIFPTMVAVNATGSGHGRMFWLGTTYDTSGLYGSYVSSGLWTKQLDLYINMILYASQKNSLIPYIYSDSSQPSYYPGVTLSMLGNNDGQQIIWFSDFTHTTGGTQSIATAYQFNGKALGLSNNWIALNLATMSVVDKGSGATVSLPIAMQNETWAPVYLGNLTSTNLGLVYSNSVIRSQAVSGSLATYTVGGPPGSASWLVLSANAPPAAVTSIGQSLPQYSSLSSLTGALTAAYDKVEQYNWTPPSGWYYDPANSLLYVEFEMGSPSTIVVTPSVVTSSSASSSSSSSSASTSSSSSSTTSTATSSASTNTTTSASSTTSVTNSTSTFLSTSSSSRSSSSSSSSTSTSSSTSAGQGTGANATASVRSSTSSVSTSKTTTTSQSFGFHIDLSSGGGAMLAGGEIQTAISVVVDFGGPHPVGLSVTGEPPGVSSSFSTVAGTAPFASALILGSSSSVAPGTYQLTVKGSSGTQVSSATFVLTVDPAANEPTATYTETVSSSPSQGGTTDPPAGAYSFESGRLLTVTALPFTGWALDHWLVNGSPAGNGTKFSFIGAGDISVEAVFSRAAPQSNPVASVSFTATGASGAQVIVDGIQYPLPTSFSWAVGSTHLVSAQTPIPEGSAARVVLAGWEGGVNSSSPEASFTVGTNMTLIAKYQSEYLVGFSFTDSAGASVAAQNATIYGPQGLITVTSANSSAWLEAGATYTPLGGTVGGVVVPIAPGATSFTVDGPMTVAIPLSTYSVSIKVVDMFGQPISGANVTLTTSGQERLTQTTGDNGSASFTNIPMGWFHATYSYLGVSGSLESGVTGAHSESVTMALSYPVFTVAAVFAGLIGVSYVARRRRSTDDSNSFDDYSTY
jgi:hypothetical protein